MSQDPRYQLLEDLVTKARIARVANNEQLILEFLYRLRETAWDINADILAKRWRERPHTAPALRRNPIITVDDLMS
jgi:hypothetical protein